MLQLTMKVIFHCVLWDSIWCLRNFVYQKDVSEYCRRRAVPSVFLGRHVMETNAQMLHFSKLDLPYSCFISIRTQSSSNIIMVILLSPRSELSESCQENENQFIVYEFGETFGGYWGAIPANVVNPNPRTTTPYKLYTLRTTQSTMEITQTKTTQESTEKPTTTWRPTEDDRFITEEVPLVNLSARLVPDESPVDNSFDKDDTFDLLYDVTPRKGESYETSILPLVQFSLRRQDEYGRRNENGEARYELDYNLGTFTPDYRKNNVLPTSMQGHEMTEIENGAAKDQINQESLTLIEHIMKSLNKSKDLERKETELPDNYAQVIRNISDMRHNFSAYLAPWPMYTYLPLSKTTVNNTENRSSSFSTSRGSTEAITQLTAHGEETTKQLFRINEKLHSTKLHQDVNTLKQPRKDTDDDVSVHNINVFVTSQTTPFNRQEFHHRKPQSGITLTKYNVSLNKLVDHADKHVTKTLSNITKYATFAFTTTKRSLGSLVDHESWENVVQSAPVMAVLLNQHAPNETGFLSVSNKTHEVAGINRKRGKRHIKSIPIGPARPHAPSARQTHARARSSQVADMQDFAQLVELPDDELSSHVALRFMRQYAGPALFNICDTHESAGYKMRHVVLFNTSRIILALGNFSVSRMTVVLTTGETLLSNEAACAPHRIECQVGGSRVCIDSTSACDGVPNCGAYDIYDEDRLQCGGAMGLQHNVVLAAITFLAVLLTMLYIVHYWLKRCVPKVADAFFIYTDSAENVLFLDSIMRSPTDVDNISKFVYPTSYYEETMNIYKEDKKKSFLQRCSEALSKLNFFKRRPKSCELTEVGDLQELNPTGMRKMYSFTELEISKMIGTSTVDEEAQTTESLEMAFLKLINMYKKTAPVEAPEKKPPRQKDILYQRLELLSKAESSFEEPGPSTGNVGRGYRDSNGSDERELHSTVYEPHGPGTVPSQASNTKEACASEGTVNSKKCLRFEEQATFIVPENDRDLSIDGDVQGQFTSRQSVNLGSGSNKLVRRNINSLETIPQESERTGTDFRSFFMGKKSKKKKNQK